MTLDSIGAASCGKVLGVTYGLIGLVVGALVSLFAILGGASGDAGMLGMIIGAGAIIAMPIFYGVAGFIGGLIFAVVYNVVANMVGGIELNLK